MTALLPLSSTIDTRHIPLKIVCIIHSLNGGGAERVMANLATRLSERGHRVVLITLDDGSRNRHCLGDKVVRKPLDVMGITRGPVEKLAANARRLSRLRRAILGESPDVLLSFCDQTNVLVSAATIGLKIPLVISERSDPAEQRLGRLWEMGRRRLYPRVSRLVALTETSAATLRRLSDRPVDIVPSAVDLPVFSGEPEIDEASGNSQTDRRQPAGVVLGIGRLEYEKGFDRLIQAFANVVDQQQKSRNGTRAGAEPNWTLRILGEGTQRRSLMALADQLGVADRVSLPGWVRPVWNELRRATIFALPSRYEGFPSALLEAMAAGVPSLAVDCESGPRAIITSGLDGLLVNNSIEGLSAGLTDLIRDPALRQQLGIAGQCVIERFGWDQMVDRYEAILMQASAAR